MESKFIKFVCISDTHNLTNDLILPNGDILIHCGDFTVNGSLNDVVHFNNFLKNQKQFKYKIVIAGNHDISFDLENYKEIFEIKKKKYETYFYPEFIKSQLTDCIYLENSSVKLFGYKIFGSPFSQENKQWAFQKKYYQMNEIWNKIPDDTDILITHSPPKGILDKTRKRDSGGCLLLLDAVLNRIKPKFHLFGHIHEGYGQKTHQSINFINCSICTEFNLPTNSPITFTLPLIEDEINKHY